MFRRFLLLPLLAGALPVAAAPELALPLACPQAGACFIQNYVDHDAGAGFRDHRCGALAYDAHNGTDFRVSDLAALARGVPVLAAAAGRVTRVREGFPDRTSEELQDRDSLPRDGGNQVTLEHEDGWTTRYAHLRAGSIAVRPGQRVEKGAPLALMGLSGRTEFPHLHFELRHNGRVVDPFAPDWKGCVVSTGGLWGNPADEVLAYRSPFQVGRGFADRAPSAAAILRDACEPEGPVPANPAALVFWGQFSGVAAGDEVIVRLRSPGGQVLSEKASPHKASKAIWLAYSGVRRPVAGWLPGLYRGEWLVKRLGVEVRGGEETVCIVPDTVSGMNAVNAPCVREVPSCARR